MSIAGLCLGCSVGSPSGRPGDIALPTTRTAPTAACAGVGISFPNILHGSPADPKLTWATFGQGDSYRASVTWPSGFVARFDPELKVIHADGSTVAREGDDLNIVLPLAGLNICTAPPIFAVSLRR